MLYSSIMIMYLYKFLKLCSRLKDKYSNQYTCDKFLNNLSVF